MKIILTGGGTGGHVIPILAVAQELRRYFHKEAKTLLLLWVGEKSSQEEKAAKKYRIPFQSVSCGKLRRYFSFKNFLDVFKIPIGYWQGIRILKKFKPDAIFSKGGYVSAPIILAARKSKTPIYLHESDSVPGQANLYFAKFAKKIFVAFPVSREYFGKFKEKVILSGMPLRSEILHGSKSRGYHLFGLEYGKPTILFLGGSQGAKRINDLVLEMLPWLLKKYQVLALVGEKNILEIKKKIFVLGKGQALLKNFLQNYHFFAYLEGSKFADAVLCADLVVSRAGANSLFEIAAQARPLILIPYPYAASDHQVKNAKVFERMEAAITLEEENLSAKKLFLEIEKIMKNEREKEKLSANIFKMYQRLAKEAAQKIVGEILKYEV